MTLFRQSILTKYINSLNKEALDTAWQSFSNYFLDAAIQAKLYRLKEEKYQEEFIQNFFVNVLGYILPPQSDFNFTLKKKSENDANESDAVISFNGDVVAVVEIKNTSLADFNKISTQAFGHKQNHKQCRYVIVSNFGKLRFYINDDAEYEEFNLFGLIRERFDLLYLCLHQKQLHENVPLLIRQLSLAEEKNITQKLSAEYLLFRKIFLQDLIGKHLNYDKLLLIRFSQEKLSCILLLLFAEDRNLIQPASIRQIISEWKKVENPAHGLLHERFEKLFDDVEKFRIEQGHKIDVDNTFIFDRHPIYAEVRVADDILYECAKTFSRYNFVTEVNVNILRHVFEHSLTDLIYLHATLDRNRRGNVELPEKSDYVLYTPDCILNYILENTLGTLCSQKKTALRIHEKNYAALKSDDDKKLLFENLKDYRDWLLHLKICDPACGTGSFLIEAFEYLTAEHRMIDELTAKLFGKVVTYTEVTNSIFKHNLYGVDINWDAVELTKVSLVLRAVKAGAQINYPENIYCGNSVMDDEEIDGDWFFDWKDRFPLVFGTKSEIFFHFVNTIREGVNGYSATAEELQAAFNKLSIKYDEPDAAFAGSDVDNLYDLIEDLLNVMNEKREDKRFLWMSLLTENPHVSQMIGLICMMYNLPLKEVYYVISRNFLKDLEENFDEYEKFYINNAGLDKHRQGFDVVIGSLPHIKQPLTDEEKTFYVTNYKSFNETGDLYPCFFERGMNILKKNGFLGFVSSNAFIDSKSDEALRTYLNDFKIKQIVDFEKTELYSDASIRSCISVISKEGEGKEISYSKISEAHFDSLQLEIEKNKIIIDRLG